MSSSRLGYFALSSSILVCASRKDGKILWQKSVKGKPNEDRSNEMHKTHGYAAREEQ